MKIMKQAYKRINFLLFAILSTQIACSALPTAELSLTPELDSTLSTLYGFESSFNQEKLTRDENIAFYKSLIVHAEEENVIRFNRLYRSLAKHFSYEVPPINEDSEISKKIKILKSSLSQLDREEQVAEEAVLAEDSHLGKLEDDFQKMRNTCYHAQRDTSQNGMKRQEKLKIERELLIQKLAKAREEALIRAKKAREEYRKSKLKDKEKLEKDLQAMNILGNLSKEYEDLFHDYLTDFQKIEDEFFPMPDQLFTLLTDVKECASSEAMQQKGELWRTKRHEFWEQHQRQKQK